MTKNKKTKNTAQNLVAILLLVGLLFCSANVLAQSLPCEAISYEDASNFPTLSMEERIKAADVVVEGQIIDKGATLTTRGTYLSYIKVQVYKVFKGAKVKKTMVILGSEYRKEKRNGKDTLITCYPNLDAFSIYPPISSFDGAYGIFLLKYSNEKIENTLTNGNRPFVLIDALNGCYHFMQKYWLIAARSKENQDSLRRIKKSDLEKEMYRDIQKYTHKKYKILKKKNKVSDNTASKSESEQAYPEITEIIPNPVSSGKISGTESTITINGTGFGTSGYILFTNANTGGVIYNNGIAEDDYFVIHQQFATTWTPTQIIVNIPSRGFTNLNILLTGFPLTWKNGDGKIPGTGGISVFRSGASPAQAFSDITIPYSITDYANSGSFRETHLYDLNGNTNEGDFTFVYDTSFYNNKPALTAFRRALNTWRQATGVRFTEECSGQVLCSGSLDSNKVKISFKKDCFTYGSNALAKTTILTSNPVCGSSPRTYIRQPEIVFANNPEVIAPNPRPEGCPVAAFPNYEWSFAETNTKCNQYNFESAALHELGHLLQQDHVINPTLMYWGGRGGTADLANVTKLSTDVATGLDSDPALTGAKYVLQRDSDTTNNCTSDFGRIQIIPPQDRTALPGCTGLCPNPCIECFPQYLTAVAAPPASLGVCTTQYATSQNGIGTNMPVTFSVINGSSFDTYTWDYDGGVELSSNAQKSIVTVQWATPGFHLVSLNIYDNFFSVCTTRQKPIAVNDAAAADCRIVGDVQAIASYIPPTNCNSTNGSILFATPPKGSLCYKYNLKKGNTVLYDSYIDPNDAAAHLYSGLGTGSYTLTIFDQITGCYLWQTVNFTPSNQLSLSTIASANYAGASPCTGEIAVTPNGGTAPFTYTWNTGYTSSNGIYSQLCGSPTGVGSVTYTVTVTDTNACTATASNQINSTFHILISESECNCDLLILGNPVTDQIQATARLSVSSNTPPNALADVLLELYNAIGFKVATLYDGKLAVPSDQQNVYSTANITPGTYYLRLRACGKSKTKPIVIY